MSQRFVDLIRTLTEPAQLIEDAALELYMGFVLPGATGYRLDLIGKRVGQLREGMGDDDFRTAIGARIAVNRSTGTYRDVIRRVFFLLAPRYERLESSGGVLFIDVGNLTLERAQFLFKFLVRAVEAAVRLQVFYLTTDDAHSFTFAEACFLVNDETDGGPKSIAVSNAEGLPEAGSLIVAFGTPSEEVITYTSRDDNYLYGVTLANEHVLSTSLQVDSAEAQGFGDEADADFGGMLADVLTS